MSRTYHTQDFVYAGSNQRTALRQQLAVAEHYRTLHHKRRAEIERSYAEATGELARAILPGFTLEILQRAAALTGYQRPIAEDALGAMERERASLKQRIAQIEADPRFAQRELLRHPSTGSLTRGLREIEEMIAPMKDVLERCQHVRLGRLIESGYGTPEYGTAFWRLSYYRDWEAADDILERFADKQVFSEVRDEYLRAFQAYGPLDAERARISAEIAAGEALEREHQARSQALATLAARWLEQVRRATVTFLFECPPGALGSRLSKDAEVELLFKRAAGLYHKIKYLDAIVQYQVDAFVFDAKKALAKIDKDLTKYRRAKHAHTRFPAAMFERRFRDRSATYQKRWQRFEKTYTRVYAFDRWDRAHLDNDLLWWNVMTDGRVAGDFIAEVHEFHRARPGYVYTRKRSDRDANEREEAEEMADAAHTLEDPVDGLLDPS